MRNILMLCMKSIAKPAMVSTMNLILWKKRIWMKLKVKFISNLEFVAYW